MEFTVVKLLNRLYGPTNKVYFTSREITPYVQITVNKKVGFFCTDVDKSLEEGKIAMNINQRSFFNVNPDDKVIVEPIKNNFEKVDSISLDVSETEAKSKDQQIIDRSVIISAFVSKFKDHVLALGQCVNVTLDRKTYTLYVQEIKPMGMIYGGTFVTVSTKDKNIIINSESDNGLFKQDIDLKKLGIGGLDEEFKTIKRKAFNSRIIDPLIIEQMGIKNLRGMLLYGPPGNGKTLIARQIANMLNAECNVVNGPELLNKFVGESEKQMRELFEPASKNKNRLHVIIFDEFECIGRSRDLSGDSTNVAKNIVAQLLSKLDGVKEHNNILVICLTNMKKLIDPALLRPGRIELHIEVGLANEEGRLQILNIHTSNLQENGFMNPDISISNFAKRTKNFTGAEIEALVKAACSFAMERSIESKKEEKKPCRPIVTKEDFDNAFLEVKPQFGEIAEEIDLYLEDSKSLFWSELNKQLVSKLMTKIKSLKKGFCTSCLIYGLPKSGKTTLAYHVAKESSVDCVKVITPEHLLGNSDSYKINYIRNVFETASTSENSIVIFDNFERLIEYTSEGPRFNNNMLQAIMVTLNKKLPKNKKMTIIITAYNNNDLLDSLGLLQLIEESYKIAVGITDKDCELLKLMYNRNFDGIKNIVDIFEMLKYDEHLELNKEEPVEEL
jgi:vesicle-fusing ATPase